MLIGNFENKPQDIDLVGGHGSSKYLLLKQQFNLISPTRRKIAISGNNRLLTTFLLNCIQIQWQCGIYTSITWLYNYWNNCLFFLLVSCSMVQTRCHCPALQLINLLYHIIPRFALWLRIKNDWSSQYYY